MKELKKEYQFKNFKQALDFVNKVGEIAESINHHPNILLHDYNKVTLILTTHSTGGVSEKDHQLSAKIDQEINLK